MQEKFKIKLEDKGQDLLFFITNYKGQIIEAGPFHSKLYVGGYIPIESQRSAALRSGGLTSLNFR
jgi:hypothetical protein